MKSKTTVKVGADLRDTTFAVTDGKITVRSEIAGTDIVLGMLLLPDQRDEILKNLAVKDFVSFRTFLAQMYLEKIDGDGQFGLAEFKFAQILMETGIPAEYAFRTAYLTSLSSIRDYDTKRIAAWEHFREKKHDVKLEHRNEYSGLTTLDVYLTVAILSNVNIADTILTRSIAEPVQMLETVRSIFDLFATSHELLLTSARNLNTLLMIFTKEFPKRHNTNGDYIYDGIAHILTLDVPWRIAEDFRDASRFERLALQDFIAQNLGKCDMIPSAQERNLAAILNAYYGEDTAIRAEKYLAENARFLRSGGHMLSVLIAALEYFKDPGAKFEAPINWVVAATAPFPLDDVFNSAYTDAL